MSQAASLVGTQPNASVAAVDGEEEQTPPYGVLVPMNPALNLGNIELVNSQYTFGRSSTCDRSFPKNKEISGTHCMLFVENNSAGEVGRVMVRDESSNGTFINGERVGKGQVAELKHGCELSLGVKSSAAAKKSPSASVKESFVSFIYKSAGAEEDIHEAFREDGGPNEVYQCAKALGSGAFAEVRLCYHRRTGAKYAAKIVDKNKFALNKELRKGSFRDEVEILKSIHNPYIVRCEDIFETDNFLTIILQFVSGGDLFDKLVALKRYSEDDAKTVFYQMAHGLKYLHDRGIAHRDLKKPENFLVRTDKSNVLVLMGDFGLARAFSGNDQFMKTLCGTPQYLAPEVIQQARASKMDGYTQAVDIWSLGVILYILLSGYPPFGPKDFDDILLAKFDFKGQRWNSVSETAKSLIRRMLTRLPEERIAVADVCAHEWLAGVAAPEIPEEDAAPPSTSSQAARVTGTSPRKARVAEEPGNKAVRFEEPEKERLPTELVDSHGSRHKLRERKPTGLKKRERREEEEEEEKEEEKVSEAKLELRESSLKKMRVAELKEKCVQMGLDHAGLKIDLINRILAKKD